MNLTDRKSRRRQNLDGYFADVEQTDAFQEFEERLNQQAPRRKEGGVVVLLMAGIIAFGCFVGAFRPPGKRQRSPSKVPQRHFDLNQEEMDNLMRKLREARIRRGGPQRPEIAPSHSEEDDSRSSD